MSCLKNALIIAIIVSPLALAQQANRLAGDEVNRLTMDNISQIARSVSFLAQDAAMMTTGPISSELTQIADSLKQFSQTTAQTQPENLNIDSLRQASSQTQQLASRIRRDRADITIGNELDRADRLFKAHSSMLAGNLANFAGHLNMIAITGGPENVSLSQADRFMSRSSDIMKRLDKPSAAKTRRQNGMYGAKTDFDDDRQSRSQTDRRRDVTGTTSGLGSARGTAGGAQIGTREALTESPEAKVGRVEPRDENARPSQQRMIGAADSPQTSSKRSAAKPGALKDMSKLMADMADSLSGQNAQAMGLLSDIVSDLNVVRNNIVSRSRGPAAGGYIGASDVDQRPDSVTCPRSDTGLGAGTGSIDATRPDAARGNTAGQATGSGAELGRREFDSCD